MYYKKLILFYVTLVLVVAVSSIVAAGQTGMEENRGLVFILALPIVLTVLLLAFIIKNWRRKK